MQSIIKIRLSGNAIDVSTDGKSSLPPALKKILEEQLRYEYVQILRGRDAYDYTGRRRPIRTEERILYSYDKYDRLVCGAGFQSRIENVLKSLGFKYEVEDCNPVHPRTKRYTEDWKNLLDNFQFRAKQDELIVQISSNNRGIISAPTGIGKTACMRAIGLLYPKAKIVITTKRKDIVESIRRDLSKYLPDVGQIGGGQCKAGRITIVTTGSLHKVNPDDVDILIADEVHEMAAPNISERLVKFKLCRMYGLSATPTGRMDNADIKLESLFGPLIFSMSYQTAVDLGLVVPIRVRWLDIKSDINPAAGMVDIPRLRNGIWRNNFRNAAIADAAREFGPDEQVLIMVTTFEHAVYLKQHLPEFTLCYAERSDDKLFSRFVKSEMLSVDEPEMTAFRRQQLRNDFESGKLKKVISTDVWSTGVNFVGLAVLIRADARSSTIMDSQIPGRVCRLDSVSGKQYGLLIDCLDQFDPGYRDAAKKRRRNYEARGWEQVMPMYKPELLKK
jgi:superfamily II DNA or RNA helicase